MAAWEKFVEPQALRTQGWSISAIAGHLGVSRVRVRRLLNGEGPGPAGPVGTADQFDEFAEFHRLRLSAIRLRGRPRCSMSRSSSAIPPRISRSPARSAPAGCGSEACRQTKTADRVLDGAECRTVHVCTCCSPLVRAVSRLSPVATPIVPSSS
jgi:hypothetical protein